MIRFALSPVTLGTAQFGGLYGIVNKAGCPEDVELKSMLELAESSGIRYFDAARAYGNAEQRLGALLSSTARERWGRITKVAPIEEFMAAHGIPSVREAVIASIQESIKALGVDFLDVVMFHRASDMDLPEAIDALDIEIASGRIGELGVSTYTPEEAVRCLMHPRIRHVQIPFNLLDRRWLACDFQQALDRRADVTIHARSVFLQGLLLSSASRWPRWVGNAFTISDALDRLVTDLNCSSRAELCLRYNRSVPWIGTTVVGVDTVRQLEAVVSAGRGDKLDAAELAMTQSVAALASSRLINPSMW